MGGSLVVVLRWRNAFTVLTPWTLADAPAPMLRDIVYLGREMKTFNETTTSLVFTTTRLHCPEYNTLSMDIILLHKRGYPMIEK